MRYTPILTAAAIAFSASMASAAPMSPQAPGMSSDATIYTVSHRRHRHHMRKTTGDDTRLNSMKDNMGKPGAMTRDPAQK